MSFAQPYLLWLLAAPVVWALHEWCHSDRRGAVLLKAAVFALILLALAKPRLDVLEREIAVAVLADASTSIPDEQVDRTLRMIQEIEAARGQNELRILTFDDSVRLGPPSSERFSGSGMSTNLEAALRSALAALPAERIPRLVLLSDGRENAGAVERAVYQAQRQGIPIDTMALPGRRPPELRLLSVSTPKQVFSGESFPIEITMESPQAGQALIELTAENNPIGRTRVALQSGRNQLTVRARLLSSGAALIRGRIQSTDLGEVVFEKTISLEKPRLLLSSHDPPESERHLVELLRAGGFEIERTDEALPLPLSRFDVIVANNQDLETWPDDRKSRLETFVREGGGFLLIAGENNLYSEIDGSQDDPLRRMLPAELAPPKRPEGTAVVLVLDKSSSMEGKKIQLARQSAIGVVDNLRRIDQVGVLVFDNSFQWTVPLRVNDEPERLKQLISGIIADGGTQIAPALHEAFQQVQPSRAVYKHILLLTDGISEEGDSIALAREAAKQKITISTVGLGQDVNRAYLERVASTAEGRSYFLIDVSALEQIVLQDVMEHTGSSFTEKPVAVEILSRPEIFEGLAFEEAGPLLGWVKFRAKPAAETLLRVREDPRDPLLTRWQYGLGRSAVFASDAKARWAVNWVDWPGFDRFWSNLVRDLLPRSPTTEVETRYDTASGEIAVSYRMAGRRRTETPVSLPDLYVLGPDEFRQVVSLEQVVGGYYEARVGVQDRYGLFRIRAESNLDLFPEIALYRPNTELEEHGANEGLLRRIADATGGRYNPSPEQVFDTGGRSIQRSMGLWPGLLALAILFSLLEVLGRKGWLPWLRGWV